jgi:1-acyl-sn-glycerol-3-phosphate acyltransferase
MVLVGVPGWFLVLALPKLSWRWRLTWATGHLLFTCLGISVEVRGALPPPGKPCVMVANHSSFLDSFVLFVVFPDPVVFVAGAVFAGQRIAGPFLRRVGTVFVRTEAGAGRSSVRSTLGELAEQVRAGHRLVLFPEGGLCAEPGLRRFQLGAFMVAGEAGSPVVPLAIVGTREMLPPGARLPRRGAVRVRVGEPLGPPEPGWAAAHRLARQAHDATKALLTDPTGY